MRTRLTCRRVQELGMRGQYRSDWKYLCCSARCCAEREAYRDGISYGRTIARNFSVHDRIFWQAMHVILILLVPHKALIRVCTTLSTLAGHVPSYFKGWPNQTCCTHMRISGYQTSGNSSSMIQISHGWSLCSCLRVGRAIRAPT